MKNFTKIKILKRPQGERTVDISEFSCEGSGLTPGIVIGNAYVFDPVLKVVPRYIVAPEDVEKEKRRFVQAVETTSLQLDAVKKQANLSADDPIAQLFDVYRHILTGSRLLRGVKDRIAKDRINAEAALQMEIALLAEAFVEIQDSYLSSRMDDIKGLAARISKNMSSHITGKLNDIPENTIVISKRFSTADATFFDLEKITGIVIEKGSQQSHAALLSRSLGLPAVISVPDLSNVVHTGDVLIIDGTYGKVIVNPTQETVLRYRKYRADFLRWKRRLKKLAHLPSVTVDNVAISLKG